MQDLLINNQPGMQILAMLGIGAVLVAIGCLLLELLGDSLEKFSRLGLVSKVAVLFFVVQLTMFGGAKHGTNDVANVDGTNVVELTERGTNDVEDAYNGEAYPPSEASSECGAMRGVSAPLLIGFARPLTSGEDTASPFSVTDFCRGYRLESVTTNESFSYAMPDGATVRGTWHLTGAYEDVMKVGLDCLDGLGGLGFRFPLGTNVCTSLWAYTWGKVRPQLRNASNEIVVIGAPMSSIPGVSRFWTAATSNDSYLMTWENFAVGRINGGAVSSPFQNGIDLPLTSGEDTASPCLNAQIEFFLNGDFVTRSNGVECVWRRVIEPNPIGPGNPEDPDTPGMPVCPYGPVQDLSVIRETNAYCWVDIVVNAADARVRFEGDGASNLADPSFAAKAGETNHVVILIGKTYKVTCDMPFTVVGKSDSSIDEWWEDGNTLWLNWPVQIEAWDGNGDSFMMHVVPNCLGGEFSWTNSCCAVYGGGLHFSYGCDGFCLCGGCSARGYYGYEGYRIGCNGGSCGCSWYDDDDRHGEDDPDDPEPTPGVSVSFSKEAVIFEDAYTNMPGQVVQWQSTATKLTLEAHGGMKGGTATFTFTNKEKLIGPDIPTSISVPAGHCKTYEFTYRGNLPSGSEEDITVHGEFQENNPEEGSQPLTTDAKLTSVKVELTCKEQAPQNNSTHRHIFGVREGADSHHYPADADVTLTFNSDDATVGVDGDWFYCPWTGGVYELTYCYKGVVFKPLITVLEPQVVCRDCEWDRVWGTVGCAGQVRMNLYLYVEPSTVSFNGIFMEEIPVTTICPHGGYFDDPDVNKTGAMSHSEDALAGVWTQVHGDEWTADRVERHTAYPQPWVYGWKEWSVPVGWGDLSHTIKGQINPDPTTQRFEIEANGTSRIFKYNHVIERRINNDVYLDGVLQN